MLNNVNKSITLSANSIIGGDDAQKIVMYMNANINPNKDLSINQSIRDKGLYIVNQQEVDKDYDEFKKLVMDCIE